MSDQTTLSAEVRTQFGKGFARRLRAAHKIPAVLYGHGTEPVHLALPGHETLLLVRRANALVELDIEGRKQLALVKDVQRDPVRQVIEHVDLVVINKGEKVHVDVPLVVVGEPFAGTIANLDATSLSLEVLATDIPDHIEVDVEGLEDGAQITAADVKLPEGATLVTEPDTLVIAVATPQLDTTSDAEGDAEAPAEESSSDEAAE
ncbi:50S ribosomal protein L25/general stress protein Ctc [Microbacterium album]|uniref:Large ribosomal subunit protein bL25 n=1 Tax=Microbacterium album TaxID=2053191 RepID=A0A917ML36_9MICO|nr:50S ribosomal protein L25/general stress protein Ctc [Microbacterium album]GGH38220.1 50S ribosomal protein L25 [Microbacterium album]